MAAEKPLSVTLIIPGLLAFPPQQWQELTPQLPKLPALSELLNQAQRVLRNACSYESMLAAKFGFSPQQLLPIAALTYWHDKGKPPSEAVLRADPVYLKVDRDCIYLLGRNSLQVSQDEAKAIISQINSVYSDTPWSMEMGAADRWYIRLEEGINIETQSLTEAFGKNIDGYLPQGAAGNKWRAVLNEIQMLLHNNEVNSVREIHQQLPINSIWFWGEGSLPSRPANRSHTMDYVWSNEPLCRGLAHWAQCPCDDLPDTVNELTKQKQTGEQLIVFDDMRILAKEDNPSFESKLIELDNNWLAPLQKAVNIGQLQLRIETENGAVFDCRKKSWINRWRKKRLWYEWFH